MAKISFFALIVYICSLPPLKFSFAPFAPPPNFDADAATYSPRAIDMGHLFVGFSTINWSV